MEIRPIEKILADHFVGPFDVALGVHDERVIVDGVGTQLDLDTVAEILNEHSALVGEVVDQKNTINSERASHTRTCDAYQSEVLALARRAADAEQECKDLKVVLVAARREAWRVIGRAKKLGYLYVVQKSDECWFMYEAPTLGRQMYDAAASLESLVCLELVTEGVLAHNSFEALFDDEAPQENPHTDQNKVHQQQEG